MAPFQSLKIIVPPLAIYESRFATFNQFGCHVSILKQKHEGLFYNSQSDSINTILTIRIFQQHASKCLINICILFLILLGALAYLLYAAYEHVVE